MTELGTTYALYAKDCGVRGTGASCYEIRTKVRVTLVSLRTLSN